MNAQPVAEFIENCKQGLTHERLKALLSYDPETGQFTRLIRTAHRIQVGDKAGSFASNGYLYICLPDKKYLAHRLAWLYVYGEMPREIDHINGNRCDNRIANLRSVTRGENNQNHHKLKSNNTTGYKGVQMDKRKGTYNVILHVDGKCVRLGSFPTLELAAEASRQGRLLHHTHTNERVNI